MMVSTSPTYAPYTDLRRVELVFDFGVIAPDAADTAQASSSAQSPMSVISQTVDDVEEMGGKYTTLEKNMWVLDGTMELYPGTQTGWQSDPLSEDDGSYTANPWLDFQFPENQDSYGFTLIFDNTQPNNYPKQVITTTYDFVGSQIGTLTTYPTGYAHEINLPSPNYRRVHFEFVGTGIPNRRIRVCSVRFGIQYRYRCNEHFERDSTAVR